MLIKKLGLALLLSASVITAAAQSSRNSHRDFNSTIASGLESLGIPAKPLQEPSGTPPVQEPQPIAQSQPDGGPLIPPTLWESLPALGDYRSAGCPDCPTDWTKFLAERLPDVDQKNVRALPWDSVNGADGADTILERAVKRRLFAMDVFTDAAFTTSKIYFLPQEVITKIFKKYQLRIVTIDHGMTKDGDSFVMRGLAVGNGRLEMLYVRSNPKKTLKDFHFQHPELPHEFQLQSQVTQKIEAYDDLSVKGIRVRETGMHDIVGFTLIPPNHINTKVKYWGSVHPKIRPAKPLCLKSDPECLKEPTEANQF